MESQKKDNNTWKEWYLAIQGLFYFAQGIMMSAVLMMVVYFQDEFGVDPGTAIAFQGLILMPSYLKIIYGVISDRYPSKKFGRRRPYIFFAGLISAIGWFIFAIIKDFGFFIILMALLINLGGNIADAVFDALGVDVTPPHRRSVYQGIGWGLRGLGGALSGIVFGFVVQSFSWSAAFIIFGIFCAIAIFFILLIKEPRDESGNYVSGDINWGDFGSKLKEKDFWLISLFMILAASSFAITVTYSTFMNDGLALSVAQIGVTLSLLNIGQFFGALISGWLGHRFRFKYVFLAELIVYMGMLLIFLLNPFSSLISIYVMSIIIGAVANAALVTLIRLMMEFSTGKTAGMSFSWFMSLGNMGMTLVGAIFISNLKKISGSYLIGMQAQIIFVIITIFFSLFLLKKVVKTKKSKGETTLLE